MINVPHAFVILTAVAACLHDVRSRRIPNYVTFGSAALALAHGAAAGGWVGLGAAAGGWALGVALFAPFFLLRGMGAGDVKLLAALGAWIGPASLLSLTFYTAISGGVMALVLVMWRRKLAATFENLWLLLCHFRVAGLKPMSELSLENKSALSLPYGLPIAAGAMLTLWLQ
jgi:prepilin peptidase CpaA